MTTDTVEAYGLQSKAVSRVEDRGTSPPALSRLLKYLCGKSNFGLAGVLHPLPMSKKSLVAHFTRSTIRRKGPPTSISAAC
jgi:hypothetical protein